MSRARWARLLGWLGKIFAAGIMAGFIAIIAGSDLVSHFLYSPAQAQPVEDPRWTQFTHQQDTLISNNVRSVLAGEDALWFGTDAGISRYTGEWVSFAAADRVLNDFAPEDNREDYASTHARLGEFAPPGQTTALAGDAQGRIWAGTDLGAVAVRDSEAWYLALEYGPPVNALTITDEGVWIGTDEGLYLYTPEQTTFIEAVGMRAVYTLAADGDRLWVGVEDGLWRKRDGRWVQISANERWLAEGVFSLWVDERRTLWAGTRFGIVWRHYSSSRWQRASAVDEHGLETTVQSLATDHSGALWAGTDGAGVFSYIEEDSHSNSYGAGRDTGLGSRFVRGVAVDQDGSVWLATPAGVFRYQAYMWYTETVASGANDYRDFVNDLLVDDRGRLWIATGGAGIRMKPKIGAPEVLFGPDDGVPEWVFALVQDAQGTIWAGTHDGLARFSGDEWDMPMLNSELPGPEVISLLAVDDRLWIGTTAGLARYEHSTQKISILRGLNEKSIEALAMDGTGALWIGAEPGIYVLDTDDALTFHRHEPGLESSLPGGPVTANGMARDPHNPAGMWVNLRDTGLNYWDGASWQQNVIGDQIPGNLVWRLYSDPDEGSLWIGGEAGLSRLDGTTWVLLSAQDGLQTASIHAIAPSSQGGYWIGGRNGLTHFRPDSTAPWIRVKALGGMDSVVESPLSVDAGETFYLQVEVGDLQTLDHRMRISYRRGQNEASEIDWDEWQPTTAGVVPFEFGEIGTYRVEFQARDLSFNYSEPVGIDVVVSQPAAFLVVPVLGTISHSVFQALITLGLLVVGGSVYISVELVRHRRRSIEAVERKFNPYISGEPVRRDDMFFGRRALLQRIVDTLHHNSIMIHGERRIGKTTLLYQLSSVLRDVDDHYYWFIPVYIDLEGTEQGDFFHYLIEEIAHAVETNLELDIASLTGADDLTYRRLTGRAYTDREFNRDLREVVQAMQTYGEEFEPYKQARLILLLDEMDVVSAFDQLVQQQLRRIFMREFAATVGAVVAGIQISKAWERVESPWFNLFNEIALEPFTRAQGRELLMEPVKGYYTYRHEAVEFILDMADGRPFRIQQYGLEAVNQMLLANRRTILLRDAQRAHQRLCAIENGQTEEPGLPSEPDPHP